MESRIEVITPERAASDLATKNTRNYRKRINEGRVNRYALDIANRRWRLTGEAIKYDQDGQLADGQHRLEGCVKAGVPFETLVIYGVALEAVQSMDGGWARSLENVLAQRGEHKPMELAAAVSLGWRWDHDLLLVKLAPSREEALEWLRENPKIREGVEVSRNHLVRVLHTPPSVGALITYRAQALAPEDEVAFRQQLISGVGLERGNPILVLRNWLLVGEGARKGHGAPDTTTRLALWIKAWNAWLSGRSIQALGWRRDGINREPFPIMAGRNQEAKRAS